MGEVAGVRPIGKVGGGVDPYGEGLSVRDYHDPRGGGGVPDYFRIPELGAVDGDDGVVEVFGECIAAVGGVGNFLDFFLGGVERIDGDDAICLIRKEPRGIVDVYYCGAGKDGFAIGARVNGNGLVGPMEEVFRGGMPPMLVASDVAGGVVCDFS